MKKWCILLFLIACVQVQQPQPAPVFEEARGVPVQHPAQERELAPLYVNLNNEIIPNSISFFSFVSADPLYDNFAIIPVERYDARYQSRDVTVVVHVFEFSSRQELDVVLNSEFYEIITRGASSYQTQNVALFLSEADHRITVWSSGTALVYVDTFSTLAAAEIIGGYLKKYPSDLESPLCIDSDGDDHFVKGSTNKVIIGSTVMKWNDVCLRDFELYKTGRYAPRLRTNDEDALLEGRCQQDRRVPGFISEYACPRGCQDGKCVLP